MPRRFIAVLLATSLAAPAALAKPSEPLVAPKGSAWVVNYDDDSCHLLRTFGEGSDQIALRMTRFEPSDSFELAVYGPPFRSNGLEVSYVLDFGSDGSVTRGTGWTGTFGKFPMAVLGPHFLIDRDLPTNGPPLQITPDQEAAIRSLTLKVSSGRAIRFELGSMGKPMVAFRECIDNLVRGWGLDPEVQRNLSRRATPIGNPGNWLGSGDYPLKDLDNGNNGLVHFRLEVAPDGAVSGCTIQLATKSDNFAEQTCKLITRRARFSPALDADGKPAKSYYVCTVRWMMG